MRSIIKLFAALALTLPSLAAGVEIPRWPTPATLDGLYGSESADEVVAGGVLVSIGANTSQHPAEDFFFAVLEREPAHVLAAHGLLLHCARRANVPLCGDQSFLRSAAKADGDNGAMWVALAAAVYNHAGPDAALPLVERAAAAPAYDSYGTAYMRLFNRLLRDRAPLLPTHHQQLVIGYSGATTVEVRLYGICQSETSRAWTNACLAVGRRIASGTDKPTTVGIGHKYRVSMLERLGEKAMAAGVHRQLDQLKQSLAMPNPSRYFEPDDPFWYELIETQIDAGELAGAELVRERTAGLAPLAPAAPDQARDSLFDQVAEGLVVATSVRSRVNEYTLTARRVPASREEAGLSAAPEDQRGRYVHSVDVVEGQIVITYGRQADEKLRGLTLVLTPYASDAMALEWQCGYAPPPVGMVPLGSVELASTVPPDLLPSYCVR